jgi:hypothetical protein
MAWKFLQEDVEPELFFNKSICVALAATQATEKPTKFKAIKQRQGQGTRPMGAALCFLCKAALVGCL